MTTNEIVHESLKLIYFYKLSDYKFFCTTCKSNSNANSCIYECEVLENETKINLLFVSEKKNNEENSVENKFSVVSQEEFDSYKKRLLEFYNTYLENSQECRFFNFTHDIFSNVYFADILISESFEQISSYMIENEQILNISFEDYTIALNTIDSFQKLNDVLEIFVDEELEINVIDQTISTNPYQTMRNSGSCLTQITEYYIPKFTASPKLIWTEQSVLNF